MTVDDLPIVTIRNLTRREVNELNKGLALCKDAALADSVTNRIVDALQEARLAGRVIAGMIDLAKFEEEKEKKNGN